MAQLQDPLERALREFRNARKTSANDRTTARRLPDRVALQLDQPTLRHELLTVTVQPGVVSDSVREVFGFLKCAYMAAALHELSGWPFAVLFKSTGGRERWIHLGVCVPDGRVLDVFGAQSPAVMCERYAAWEGSGLHVESATAPVFLDLIGRRNGSLEWWKDGGGMVALHKGRSVPVDAVVMSFAKVLLAGVRRAA